MIHQIFEVFRNDPFVVLLRMEMKFEVEPHSVCQNVRWDIYLLFDSLVLYLQLLHYPKEVGGSVGLVHEL